MFLIVCLIVEYNGLSAAPVIIEPFNYPELRIYIIRLADRFEPLPYCCPYLMIPLSKLVIWSFIYEIVVYNESALFFFFNLLILTMFWSCGKKLPSLIASAGSLANMISKTPIKFC